MPISISSHLTLGLPWGFRSPIHLSKKPSLSKPISLPKLHLSQTPPLKTPYLSKPHLSKPILISLKAHLSKPLSLKTQLKIPMDLPSTCHGQNEEATGLKLSALRTIVISSGLGISDGLAQHINAQITPSKTRCCFVSIVTNQCPNHDIEMRVHYHAPVNYVCLHCVTPSMRALSMAMSTVSIHIFGDVPSSPLVGVLQDYINNWRETALILTSVLFLAAAIWFGGIFLHSVDRFNEEGETNVPPIERSNQQPLLDGNTTAPEESA